MFSGEPILKNKARIATRAVHSGEIKDKPYGSLTMPIVQTSTYSFEDTEAVITHMKRKQDNLPPLRGEYGRYGNPTQTTVERKLAELDSGEDALILASGMAAATTILLTLLESGDHIIVTDDLYRRTREFCLTFLGKFGVETTLVQTGDYQAMADAIRPTTKLIFSEAPSNPYMRVIDVPRVAEIAQPHGVKLMIDSTFASPINFRPLEHGADIVIHSASKYLGGHNDLLGGAIIASAELITALRDGRGILGPVVDPQNAYLLLRGLKTLAVRIKAQNENGLRVAQFLEGKPQIRRVWYPGLTSHPDHEIAARLMEGYAGVVTFEVEGGLAETGRFIDAMQIPYIGPSLGGVESIIEQPALMSHFTKDRVEREAIGITDELVRLALGIEDPEDLIEDLQRGLDAV
jgi:cystathionine gamma-synthase